MEISTDLVPAAQRLDFWRHTVLRRMEIEPIPAAGRPFHARVRRLSGEGIELLDYASDAIWMSRTTRQCRADSVDEVSIGLVLGASTGALQNGHELSLRRGELYVIDFGQSVRSLLATHHEIAIMLPRRRVVEAVGADPGTLGGTRLTSTGLGRLLVAHLRTIAARAALSPDEQITALSAAGDLALAVLQTRTGRRVDLRRFAGGIYVAARDAITRCCGDPEFTPARLARLAGCSRATLYRIFAGRNQSVGDEIWEARLQRGMCELTAPGARHATIAEIAFRCGFLDASGFSRMFKRRYGVTPTEIRDESAERGQS